MSISNQRNTSTYLSQITIDQKTLINNDNSANIYILPPTLPNNESLLRNDSGNLQWDNSIQTDKTDLDQIISDVVDINNTIDSIENTTEFSSSYSASYCGGYVQTTLQIWETWSTTTPARVNYPIDIPDIGFVTDLSSFTPTKNGLVIMNWWEPWPLTDLHLLRVIQNSEEVMFISDLNYDSVHSVGFGVESGKTYTIQQMRYQDNVSGTARWDLASVTFLYKTV